MIRKNNLPLLFLIVIIVLCLIYIYKRRGCFKLNKFRYSVVLKKEFKNIKRVVFIYDFNVCSSCVSGKYILSLNNQKDCLFVLSPKFTNNDIINFKEVFGIKGSVIRGDKKAVKILKLVSSCYGKSDWQKNCLMRIQKDGVLEFVKYL